MTSTPPDDRSEEFTRLSAVETAISLPVRPRSPIPRPSHDPATSARARLEQIVEPALASGPCYVMFSGGRDSSALLALTTHVARRIGADDPVPITAVHPDTPETDEREWQDLILSHLQIRERVEIELHGEQSWLGDVATAALERHGLVWPEAIQIQGAVLSQVPEGATLITGEGGDQVLDARRATVAKQSVRQPRTALRHLNIVAAVLAPSSLTSAIAHRKLRRTPFMAWLRPTATAVAAHAYSHAESEPFAWDRATRGSVAGPQSAIVRGNFDAAIREYRLRPLHPFFDRSFASALGAAGGFWGFGDRTEQMEHLFADLLPAAILRRTTKAVFTSTRWGDRERTFAREWDGSGLDPELIDPEPLRAAWLEERPPYGVALLMHAAWLAARGRTPHLT